ncbi:MAG: alpha/beta fold hydrolase, partial [Bacteriovoracaceae bacterium]
MKWIFLRGLAREAEHWGDFPKQFLDSKLADDVFLIDAPGLGTKYEQSSPVSISQYVSAMRPEFLTLRRQYSGPWGVLAISMGAMVAMEWMKRHPQDFFCSVLINTSASNFSTPFDRLSPKTMKKLSKIFVFNEPVKNEKTIFDLTTHMSHQNENDILKRHVEIAEKRPISRANFLSQLF